MIWRICLWSYSPIFLGPIRPCTFFDYVYLLPNPKYSNILKTAVPIAKISWVLTKLNVFDDIWPKYERKMPISWSIDFLDLKIFKENLRTNERTCSLVRSFARKKIIICLFVRRVISMNKRPFVFFLSLTALNIYKTLVKINQTATKPAKNYEFHTQLSYCNGNLQV